jgi:hypothetical protein
MARRPGLPQLRRSVAKQARQLAAIDRLEFLPEFHELRADVTGKVTFEAVARGVS